jgi:DNA-directed RNA polymerase specialized sigma24 family protein
LEVDMLDSDRLVGAPAPSLDHAYADPNPHRPRVVVRARRLDAPRHVPDPIEYWGTADLRRRRSRAFGDEVLARAQSLPAADAALLRAVFVDHTRMTQLAALTRMHPRRVRYHLRALVNRVMAPEFTYVLRPAPSWPIERRRVAHAVIILGHSLRRVSRDLGLSLHTVRTHAAQVRAMCEAARHLAAELSAHALSEAAHA